MGSSNGRGRKIGKRKNPPVLTTGLEGRGQYDVIGHIVRDRAGFVACHVMVDGRTDGRTDRRRSLDTSLACSSTLTIDHIDHTPHFPPAAASKSGQSGSMPTIDRPTDRPRALLLPLYIRSRPEQRPRSHQSTSKVQQQRIVIGAGANPPGRATSCQKKMRHSQGNERKNHVLLLGTTSCPSLSTTRDHSLFVRSRAINNNTRHRNHSTSLNILQKVARHLSNSSTTRHHSLTYTRLTAHTPHRLHTTLTLDTHTPHTVMQSLRLLFALVSLTVAGVFSGESWREQRGGVCSSHIPSPFTPLTTCAVRLLLLLLLILLRLLQ